MRHYWIDTSLPQALRDKHPILANAPEKIEQCFLCTIVKTEENADGECDRRPKLDGLIEPVSDGDGSEAN